MNVVFTFDEIPNTALDMVATSDGLLRPATPNVQWVTPDYGMPIDISRYVTGDITYSVVEDEYWVFALQGNAEQRNSIWQWLRSNIHGHAVDMTASNCTSYKGEIYHWSAECTVTDESERKGAHELVKIAWSRAPYRTLEPLTWSADLDVDWSAAAPFTLDAGATITKVVHVYPLDETAESESDKTGVLSIDAWFVCTAANVYVADESSRAWSWYCKYDDFDPERQFEDGTVYTESPATADNVTVAWVDSTANYTVTGDIADSTASFYFEAEESLPGSTYGIEVSMPCTVEVDGERYVFTEAGYLKTDIPATDGEHTCELTVPYSNVMREATEDDTGQLYWTMDKLDQDEANGILWIAKDGYLYDAYDEMFVLVDGVLTLLEAGAEYADGTAVYTEKYDDGYEEIPSGMAWTDLVTLYTVCSSVSVNIIQERGEI